MKFVSSENPQARSDHELLVFCYEDERVLLPLPPTYADAIHAARDTFQVNLHDDIVFETADLAGCTDIGMVQIREAAWPAISPILSKVFVRTTKRPDVVDEMNRISQRLSLRDPVPKSHRLFDSLSGGPVAGQSSSSSSALSRRSFGPSNLPPPTSTSIKHSSRPSLSERLAALPDPRESLGLPASARVSTNSARRSTDSAKHSEKDELIEEEEEEEERYAHPTPSKSRAARKRIVSDDEDDEEYDRVHTDEGNSPRDDAEDEAAVEHEVMTVPFSQASDTAKASTSSADTGVVVKQEKPDTLVAKIERMSLSKAIIETPDLQSLVGPLDSAEKTFLISVDYDDGDPEGPRTSTFKTKGRHTVHKVLYTVCRTFGVEDYYAQAQLMLVVEEETDNDEIIEHKFMCVREDTMEKAGARPDSQFLLVLDNES